jgi:hypothetical protein
MTPMIATTISSSINVKPDVVRIFKVVPSVNRCRSGEWPVLEHITLRLGSQLKDSSLWDDVS